MHTLLFLEPGHFHAALTLRVPNPRVDRSVHLYAAPGPERDAFIALVRAFNSRADDPTHWDLRVHESADPERALTEERRGAAVILAGRNQPKLGAIARLHAAGFHVLADKPWLTDGAALPDLERATAGWPLAMDVMTFRHEVVAALTRRAAASRALFGELDASSDEPAIDIRSVHHLLKVVNGAPLRRPAWYYDTRVQGDGLVDIQSHMTDQAQWLVGDEAGFDYRRDFALEGADRWSTPVPLDLFRASTGRDRFPDALREQVTGGVLALACNGEIRYRLRGITVRQRAEWGQREPEGGGDAHGATVRGTEAAIVARHGPETGFRAELHVAPRDAGARFDARLDEALAAWRRELPGLSRRPSSLGHEIVIPDALHTPHEAHFAMVLDRFLDHVESAAWPAALAARIRSRYTLLAEAHGRGGPAAERAAGDDPAWNTCGIDMAAPGAAESARPRRNPASRAPAVGRPRTGETQMPDTRHGHFHWNELNTWNVEEARKFYARTLGWTFEQFPMADGGDYTVCMSDGEPVAGLFELRKGMGVDDVPNHWFAYIAVDDVDARLPEVEAGGGAVCRPPFDVPSVGRISIVRDSTGAVVGWITPAEPA